MTEDYRPCSYPCAHCGEVDERCPNCGELDCEGECADDIEIDVAHLRYADGTCRVSVNGQGHFPCNEHPKIDPPVCCDKPMHGNPAPKDWVCRECGSVAGAS